MRSELLSRHSRRDPMRKRRLLTSSLSLALIAGAACPLTADAQILRHNGAHAGRHAGGHVGGHFNGYPGRGDYRGNRGGNGFGGFNGGYYDGGYYGGFCGPIQVVLGLCGPLGY